MNPNQFFATVHLAQEVVAKTETVGRIVNTAAGIAEDVANYLEELDNRTQEILK